MISTAARPSRLQPTANPASMIARRPGNLSRTPVGCVKIGGNPSAAMKKP